MEILALLPVLLIAIVVHEVAHAWVARREGDDTADRQGRITLNPIPHLDPVGSLLVPLILFVSPGGFIFGWAKPVPVNPENFRDPVWGDIRVSLAGVASNFVLAGLSVLAWAGLVQLQGVLSPLGVVYELLVQAARFSVLINLILAIFNLIPLPPLDGSHVVYHMLPKELGRRYREVGKYGLLVLMAMFFLVPGVFRYIFWPVQWLMGVADSFVRLWM